MVDAEATAHVLPAVYLSQISMIDSPCPKKLYESRALLDTAVVRRYLVKNLVNQQLLCSYEQAGVLNKLNCKSFKEL